MRIQKFVVICTKVKYHWHFIKYVRKALLLLPVNVVCITVSLIKTVSILMLHAMNTGQPWMSWAYEQRIHGQLIDFPGEYMNKWRLDFTLPLGWLYTPLLSRLLPFTLPYAVTGCSYCPKTHKHTHARACAHKHTHTHSLSLSARIQDPMLYLPVTASSYYSRRMWHFLEILILTPNIEACISHRTYPCLATERIIMKFIYLAVHLANMSTI